jgi:predicted amidohydrolase
MDDNNHEYVGHSQAIDFLGYHIVEPYETEDIFVVELSKEKMLETRSKLAFLNDKDEFEIV